MTTLSQPTELDKAIEAMENYQLHPLTGDRPSLEQYDTVIRVAKRAQELEKERDEAVGNADMICDEFQRIKALVYGTLLKREVNTICDRAISKLRQTIPVIVQRDKAERELSQLRTENQELKDQFDTQHRDKLRTAYKEALEALSNLVRDDSSWPIDEVANKLVDAVQHLLNEHNCDAHSHEQFAIARNHATLIPTAARFAREALTNPLAIEVMKEKKV